MKRTRKIPNGGAVLSTIVPSPSLALVMAGVTAFGMWYIRKSQDQITPEFVDTAVSQSIQQYPPIASEIQIKKAVKDIVRDLRRKGIHVSSSVKDLYNLKSDGELFRDAEREVSNMSEAKLETQLAQEFKELQSGEVIDFAYNIIPIIITVAGSAAGIMLIYRRYDNKRTEPEPAVPKQVPIEETIAMLQGNIDKLTAEILSLDKRMKTFDSRDPRVRLYKDKMKEKFAHRQNAAKMIHKLNQRHSNENAGA